MHGTKTQLRSAIKAQLDLSDAPKKRKKPRVRVPEPVGNRYAGVCYRCGSEVQPYYGQASPDPSGGSWRVRHLHCS